MWNAVPDTAIRFGAWDDEEKASVSSFQFLSDNAYRSDREGLEKIIVSRAYAQVSVKISSF